MRAGSHSGLIRLIVLWPFFDHRFWSVWDSGFSSGQKKNGGGASLGGSPGALSIYHVILDPFHFAAALAALAPGAKGSLSLRHGSPSPLVILDAKTRAYAEY